MKYIIIPILLVLVFALGGITAHFSLPEKGRMTEEKAHNLLHQKYRMGFLHNEDVK